MSNSPLVDYTKISPNSTNPRSKPISKITIHHMAGNLSVESCASVFAITTRQASSNYGIGTDGRVGLYVEEKNRAWTTSNRDNDNVAVTIEVANDVIGGNWHVSDKALAKLIDLCVDICQRNGIKKLNFTGDKTGNLTMHKWFASTLCPGPYLESKFPYIAEEVNKRLQSATATSPTEPVAPGVNPEIADKLYRVQVGAYSDYAGAAAQKKKVEAAGFAVHVVKADDGLYKVQSDAFENYDYAYDAVENLKDAGFCAIITTKSGQLVNEADEVSNASFKIDDKVKLVAGAKYYDGRSIPSWVFNRTLYVRQIYTNGNVVISTLPIGAVTGVVEPKYLTKL